MVGGEKGMREIGGEGGREKGEEGDGIEEGWVGGWKGGRGGWGLVQVGKRGSGWARGRREGRRKRRIGRRRRGRSEEEVKEGHRGDSHN